MARNLILREYIRDVEFLSDCLSSSSRQVGASAELLARLAQYKGKLAAATMLWGPGNTIEYYRRFLSYVVYRLQRSREGQRAQDAYKDAAEFESDLLVLRSSLTANRGQRLAETLCRSTVAPASNVWLSSSSARYPPACARACRSY